MNIHLLIENLTNPALLFFVLGIIAVYVKSDLEIPENSSKFISLYLLFAIGFKGGQELSHETFTNEIGWSMLFGISISALIPLYTFFILKRKLNVFDAGAIAAAYGSVSAVTFVTAVSYLESQQLSLHGHMVAIMALMESPAIIVGLVLISIFNKEEQASRIKIPAVIKHSLTNGSVLLILGSLVIGYLANAKQAEGIKPFTNDLFKGFLAIFLLDMGITSGRKLQSFFSFG
ncbi:MAG: sodium-dependent bicarbonate transport family permease, partial [Bacteroidetes bacterium]|nr:sodium-dependent bicarbonate transport family permease [Bacteroidota bacterium]